MTDVTAIPTLIYTVIGQVRAHNPDKPALVGVGGAQGSGKTTVCALLEAANRGRIAHFSMDDVYLTRAERDELAAEVHSLCATRGPPGTHDLDLADRTIASLETPAGAKTPLPRFDKARDERAPQEIWHVFRGLPEAIVIDGWCMGAKPLDEASLAVPLNALEANEDADGVWRRFIADQLADDYQTFFDGFDALIYLQAPSWEIVRRWRGQQEQQTLDRALTAAENAALDRFVMHYERITRSMLDGRHSGKWIAHLDEARDVVRVEER
ncbi:MAG: kinase [Caulobacteraceae bacterium]